MQTANRALLVLLLFLVPTSLYSMGFGEWWHKTPGGNQMDGISGNRLTLKYELEINQIRKWYFYADHVVGTRNTEPIWFVADERAGSITFFDSEAAWTNYTDKNGLRPGLWLRWHHDDWDIWSWLWMWIVFFIFFPGILVIPMFSFVTFLLLRYSPPRDRGAILRILTTGVMLCGAALVIIALLSHFPQSF